MGVNSDKNQNWRQRIAARGPMALGCLVVFALIWIDDIRPLSIPVAVVVGAFTAYLAALWRRRHGGDR